MTRVPVPRVISVRRRRPGRVTPGDVAEAQLAPGLIALLDGPSGAGYQARYSVPANLSATAAAAVLAPIEGTDWAGRDLEVEWFAVPGPRDVVLARARLEELTERMAQFRVDGRTDAGMALYRGDLLMMAIRDGVPVGFRSADEYAAVRDRLSQARVARVPEAREGQLLRLIRAPGSIALGGSDWVEVQISNLHSRNCSVAVTGDMPFGGGLSLDGAAMEHLVLTPGEKSVVRFRLLADRPHEVNLGKPWQFAVTAETEGERETVSVLVCVPDPNPGRTFYLLTEDCETFDGGPLTGDYARHGAQVFGNQNNFMDPEEYRVQMIRKPERMNQIAERHGARWTHFYAATQRFAAEWAVGQSATGEWRKVIEEMDRSVREGSKLHEYCPHVHFDYEPESAMAPQPRLIYDAATDGILPNCYYDPATNPTHCYHDWDGAARGIAYLKELGDWSELDSKTGSLRKSVEHLARLQANRRAPAVGRTGSYDFGKAAADQEVSTQAYLANGLRGNSDAYRPGAPAMPGGQMFWCAAQDREQSIAYLREARLAQLAITMDTMFHSAADMNRWFRAHWEAARGPGVHAILFTTHAMFLGGEPDRFRSLDGGAFTELDAHLAWVRENYPEVEFATATEALLEYLDYYTPVLEAYTEPWLVGGDPSAGRYEFAVRLLGQGIRVDEAHPADVRVTAPLCFSPGDLLALRIKQDGRTLAEESAFDTRVQPGVTVRLTARAPLRLEVALRPEMIADACGWFQDEEGLMFHDVPESGQPDLFRVRPPREESDGLRVFPDVLRLLMNPVAGGAEPLGRRVHPLGGFAIGAALSACFRAAGERLPVRMKLRWVREARLESTFLVERRAVANEIAVRIRDDRGVLVAKANVILGDGPQVG